MLLAKWLVDIAKWQSKQFPKYQLQQLRALLQIFFFLKWIDFQTKHCKRVHCFLNKTNLSFQTAYLLIDLRLAVFRQLFSWNTGICLQSYLSICAIPWLFQGLLKKTSTEMTKFPKKEPINFCYFYDSAGVTQTLLWSNQFINPTVWYLALRLNLLTSAVVLICYQKDI